MNTTPEEGIQLAKAIVAAAANVKSTVIVAPPFTHLSQIKEVVKGSNIHLSAQNCADKEAGAYTGEVSAKMLASMGVEYVILGHSERREYYGETGEILLNKVKLALDNGLLPIFCIGERLEEREANRHFEVVQKQLEEVVLKLSEAEFEKLVIAYEPVWAIGTGKTATADQAQEIHAYIRKVMADKFGAKAAGITILYGGSVSAANAKELFSKPDVDGGLVGGASLKAVDFTTIAESF